MKLTALKFVQYINSVLFEQCLRRLHNLGIKRETITFWFALSVGQKGLNWAETRRSNVHVCFLCAVGPSVVAVCTWTRESINLHWRRRWSGAVVRVQQVRVRDVFIFPFDENLQEQRLWDYGLVAIVRLPRFLTRHAATLSFFGGGGREAHIDLMQKCWSGISGWLTAGIRPPSTLVKNHSFRSSDTTCFCVLFENKKNEYIFYLLCSPAYCFDFAPIHSCSLGSEQTGLGGLSFFMNVMYSHLHCPLVRNYKQAFL